MEVSCPSWDIPEGLHAVLNPSFRLFDRKDTFSSGRSGENCGYLWGHLQRSLFPSQNLHEGMYSALAPSFHYFIRGKVSAICKCLGKEIGLPRTSMMVPTLSRALMQVSTHLWSLPLGCMTGKASALWEDLGIDRNLARIFMKVSCPFQDLHEGYLSFPGPL